MLKYFDVESTKIACWTNNRDYDRKKQNLFFIHGSGSDHSAWLHQYGRLHKKYNILAVDLPGHGRSGGNGESDVEKYCLWLKKILDGMDLKRSILVGHSLGAAITLKFALHYPQAVAGIVTVGGGMKMPVNPLFLDFLKTNPAEMPIEVIELICRFSLAKENRPQYLAPLRKSFSHVKINTLYGDLIACNDLDLTPEVKKISVPALIICGAQDKMIPPDFSRQLAVSISGAGLEIIEGAGHMVMMEKPAEFNASLDRFAASLAAAHSG